MNTFRAVCCGIGHADIVAARVEDITVDARTVEIRAHVDRVDDEDGLRVHVVAVLRRPDGGVVVGVLARDTVVRELVVGQLDILAGVTVEVGTTVEVRDIVRLEVVGRAVVVERAAQRRLVEERSQEWARLIFVVVHVSLAVRAARTALRMTVLLLVEPLFGVRTIWRVAVS